MSKLELYVIRHADAGEQADFFAATGLDDSQRPLSEEGRDQFKKAARVFSRICPKLDKVVSSHLVRARQTAEILLQRYPKLELEQIDELAPGTPLSYLRDWVEHQEVRRLAIVGHSPTLGQFISWMLTGREGSWICVKKGSITALELRPIQGEVRLLWSLSPNLLAEL